MFYRTAVPATPETTRPQACCGALRCIYIHPVPLYEQAQHIPPQPRFTTVAYLYLWVSSIRNATTLLQGYDRPVQGRTSVPTLILRRSSLFSNGFKVRDVFLKLSSRKYKYRACTYYRLVDVLSHSKIDIGYVRAPTAIAISLNTTIGAFFKKSRNHPEIAV